MTDKILTDMEDGSNVEQIAKKFNIDPTKVVIISAGDLEGNLTRAIMAHALGKKVIIVVDALLDISPKEMHERIEGKMVEYVGMTIHNREPSVCIPTIAIEKDPGRISGLIPKHTYRSKKHGKKRK